MKPSDDQVDQLNVDEWRDDSTQSIDQQVAPQQRVSANSPIAHSPKSQGNQNDDDYGVEYDSRKHSRLRSLQSHDVEHIELRKRARKHRRDDRKILRHVVGHGKSSQGAARDQPLLADLDELETLQR